MFDAGWWSGGYLADFRTESMFEGLGRRLHVRALRYLKYMLELHVIVLCWNLLFQCSENFFPCRTKFFRMTTKFTFPISKQMVSMVVANLLGRNGLQIVWCCWLELGAVAVFSCVQIQHIAKIGLPFLLSCFAKVTSAYSLLSSSLL